MNVLGKRSRENLSTCHPDLVKIVELAIQWSPTDFGVHAGGRTVEKQQEYYDSGASSINPKNYDSPEALAKNAKHIVIKNHPKYKLSRAFDFHISETLTGKDLTWDTVHLGVVIGVFFAAAKYLFAQGEISHDIRSGGDWDKDGIFIYDHKFRDLPHIELINY